MASSSTSEVEDLCRRLQKFQLQLKVIVDRNNDVLGHLEQVEDSVSTLDDSIINRGKLRENIHICRTSCRQVQDIAEKQCSSLEKHVKELVRHSDDNADLNRVTDTTLSSVKQQLVSQLDYNVALQKHKAELEARLAEKLEQLAHTSKLNDTLKKEVDESQEKMRSVLDRLDRTAKNAENRLDCLENETNKAQKTSEEYQRLYETERQRVNEYENERRDSMTTGNKRQASAPTYKDLTPMSRKPRTSSATSYLFQARMPGVKSSDRMRPQDMDTKYHCLVDENKNLHLEIRRLREENTFLMKSSKDSKKDVEIIQRYIATCQSQRSELLIRLRREQEKHHKLTVSMNKQAANWISGKKMVRGTETTNKVAKIQSESVHGAQRTLKMHSVKMNEDKPRNIPVQLW